MSKKSTGHSCNSSSESESEKFIFKNIYPHGFRSDFIFSNGNDRSSVSRAFDIGQNN